MCRLMTNRSDLSAGMRIMNWMDERELEKVAGEGEPRFFCFCDLALDKHHGYWCSQFSWSLFDLGLFLSEFEVMV